ncbi:MAG: hypothetical protein ACPG80_01720, partial [Rickettsiales bacterium]
IAEQTSLRAAPLPDPEELAQYQAIDASYPERIMAMAELAQKSNIAQIDRAQKFTFINISVGQITGWFLALAMLVGAGFLTVFLTENDAHPAWVPVPLAMLSVGILSAVARMREFPSRKNKSD